MSRNIKGITIELDGKTTGLTKALEDVNKRSRDVQKELTQVERLLKFNPGNTELVAQKQKLLGEQVQATREKLQRLKDAQNEVTEAFKRGEISEEQYRAFQRELVETESKLKHFESQLEKTQTKWDKFGEKAQQAGEKMQKVGGKMTDIGKSMSMKVTAPLTGIAAAAIKVGMDFETSMSNVAALSGATGEDLQKLEAKAEKMGSTTNKSASEAADAMGYMALAGWDTEQMLTGIEPVLKLSSAGNIDLARASELVTNSMGAMGIGVNELGSYLDVMAKTSQSADTDIDELGEAFITAGGKLRDLGVDFKEGSIALGVMADAGNKGSEAGRGLSAILTNLTHPTGQAKKAMDELGISVFDSNGEFIGIEESLKLVDGALEGMTQEQQNSYKSMIAGKEHAKTFSALMNGLGDDYDKLRDEVEGANGALDEMYDIMTDNLAGKWDGFTSALEAAGIAIFKALQPALEVILGSLKFLIDIFNALPAPMQALIVVFGALVAAIGPVLTVLGFMLTHIGSLLVAMPKIIGIVKGLGTTFTAVKTSVAVFTGAIGAISAPVLIVIGVITALIAVGVALYKNWDTVKEYAGIIWDAIAETLISVWEWISETAVEIWGALSEFFSDLWQIVTEIFTAVWESISTLLSGFWESISDNAQAIWDGIINIFENVWEIIKNIFLGAFIVIMELVTGNWESAKESTEQIWDNIKGALSEIWNSIKLIFTNAKEMITGIISSMWELVKNTFTGALNFLNDLTGGRLKSVFDIVKQYMTMISDNIKATWEFIKGTFTNVLNFLKSLVKGDFEGMKNAIKSQMDNARQLITNIWNNIKTFLSGTISNILSTVISKFKDIYNNIKSKMQDVLSTIKDIWGNVMDFFKGIDLAQIGKDMISGLIKGVASMAGALVDSVKGVVDNAIQGAKNLLGIASPSKVFMGIGEDTGAGLEIGLRKMGGRVEKASDDMVAHTILKKEVNVTSDAATVGGGDMVINIENMTVRNDEDINKISRELKRLIDRDKRGRGR